MEEAQVKFLINKPKMAQFLKFKYLIASKLNFNGVSFIRNIKKWLFQKEGKSHNKIVMFAVLALAL